MTHAKTPRWTLDLYAAFDCTGCGDCCRDWQIPVERSVFERAVKMLEMMPHPGRIQAETAFVPVEQPSERKWVRLAQTEDGSCVFLDPDGLCYWHRHFGYETKGWVCRAYPNTSYHIAGQTIVDGSLSCLPMAQTMAERFARPLEKVPTPDGFAQSAQTLFRWKLDAGDSIAFGEDRRIEAEALLALQEALLDFPRIEGVPLGTRMLMGRLFVERLIRRTSKGDTVSATHVAEAFSEVESNGTALYLEAKAHQRTAPIMVAYALRALVGRMARIGMPRRQAEQFRAVIERLRLESPPELVALHLLDLHGRFMTPARPKVHEMMSGYASHRLVRLQAMVRGGVLAGCTEAMMALMLVQAFALTQAEIAARPVDTDLLSIAISQVEKIFFHASSFENFFDAGSGFENIHSLAFAAIMASAVDGSAVDSPTHKMEAHHEPQDSHRDVPGSP